MVNEPPPAPETPEPQPVSEPVIELPVLGEDAVQTALTYPSVEYRYAAFEGGAQRQLFLGTQAAENQLATFSAATDPGDTSLAKTASFQELAAPSVFSGLFTPLTFISTVVSSVVSLLLGVVSAPSAPTEAPLLLGLLEWARRQLNAFVFNQRPVVTYDSGENDQDIDGVVTGDQIAEDPEGDPLRYTVTRDPENGKVEIHPDGTFTYTPIRSSRTPAVRTPSRCGSPTPIPPARLISRLIAGDYSTSGTIEVPVNR